MLSSIHVHNYRLFREFEVPRFRRLNVFIGKNNVGKTSLLEALHLLQESMHQSPLKSESSIRDIKSDEHRSDFTKNILGKPHFSGLKRKHSILIEGRHERNGVVKLEIVPRPRDAKEENPSQFRENLKRLGSGNYSNSAAVLRYKKSNRNSVTASTQEGSDSCLEIQRTSNGDSSNGVMIIAPNNQNQHMDAIRLAELRKQRKAEMITDLLKSIEPRIETIEDRSSSSMSTIWVDIGLKELVPLSAVGNGITQIFRILLAILSCPRGIILIDEIENGLHHSILPKLWGTINEASKESNVQIVSTCHSYECVSAMLGAVEEKDFYVYRLQRQNDGSRIECIAIEPQVLRTAIEYGMEIR